jgi:hypothetical protein
MGTMGRNDNTDSHDPEGKRPSGRAGKRGHSGYGLESVRPHLRAQLAQHDLLRPTFPPPDEADTASGGEDAAGLR